MTFHSYGRVFSYFVNAHNFKYLDNTLSKWDLMYQIKKFEYKFDIESYGDIYPKFK